MGIQAIPSQQECPAETEACNIPTPCAPDSVEAGAPAHAQGLPAAPPSPEKSRVPNTALLHATDTSISDNLLPVGITTYTGVSCTASLYPTLTDCCLDHPNNCALSFRLPCFTCHVGLWHRVSYTVGLCSSTLRQSSSDSRRKPTGCMPKLKPGCRRWPSTRHKRKGEPSGGQKCSSAPDVSPPQQLLLLLPSGPQNCLHALYSWDHMIDHMIPCFACTHDFDNAVLETTCRSVDHGAKGRERSGQGFWRARGRSSPTCLDAG